MKSGESEKELSLVRTKKISRELLGWLDAV